MSSDKANGEPRTEELSKSIRRYLLAAMHVLNPLDLDVSLYLLDHNQSDPFGGNDLDDIYSMYEERANNCRRLWMKLRALSEKHASRSKAPGNPPQPRSPLRSPSPLERHSAVDEDDLAETRRENQDGPAEIDPAEPEPDVPRQQLQTVNLSSNVTDVRAVFMTASGSTRRRIAMPAISGK